MRARDDVPVARLRRFVAAGGACEICGGAIDPDGHRHAADVAQRRLRCVCLACHAGLPASSATLRAVPTGPARSTALDRSAWDAVRAPVALAFVLLDDEGRATAFYPSPVGATESLLDPTTWRTLVDAVPLAASLRPGTEGLLLDARRDPARAHALPVDRCYGLIGRLRHEWHGVDGGAAVDAAIGEALHDAVDLAATA